jgi:hypothetical protein
LNASGRLLIAPLASAFAQIQPHLSLMRSKPAPLVERKGTFRAIENLPKSQTFLRDRYQTSLLRKAALAVAHFVRFRTAIEPIPFDRVSETRRFRDIPL